MEENGGGSKIKGWEIGNVTMFLNGGPDKITPSVIPMNSCVVFRGTRRMFFLEQAVSPDLVNKSADNGDDKLTKLKANIPLARGHYTIVE
ncbi:hypothetical protein M0802_007035 [Mischocyttarus mexicanus]|nr:hypothetical protein M0802_007035 [Mischocyttarus mexicanus]